MKHWLALLALAMLLALGMLLPFSGSDVAQLQPVELVLLYREGNAVCVETDTGDRGSGPDLAAAFGDLRATAQGELFLETVEYLLLRDTALDLLPQIVCSRIRPSTYVLQLDGEADLSQITDYLSVHTPRTTLWDWKLAHVHLEVLQQREGRWYLGAN